MRTEKIGIVGWICLNFRLGWTDPESNCDRLLAPVSEQKSVIQPRSLRKLLVVWEVTFQLHWRYLPTLKLPQRFIGEPTKLLLR